MTTGLESTSALALSGLASGLNTTAIVSALLESERQPVTAVSNERVTVEAQRAQLQSIQSNLTQLTYAAQELGSAELFSSAQTVTSSNSAQLTATVGSGAAVGGYEVEVTQLANSAQRTFTFTSPASAGTVTIDGQEFHVAAGESIQGLVSTINASSTATVYAAALAGGTLVLSTRATGASESGFISVTGSEGILAEQAALAKAGRDAIYSIDGGSSETSSSNTVTGAIPGVTLNLKALTTTTGPVTVEVQPPAPDTSAIVAQVQSFVKLYNSTISAVQHQLSAKRAAHPESQAELATGTLYGDTELLSLLNEMRQSNYTSQTGLPSEMSSLADIGVSTGAPSATTATSQSTLEGQLQVNTATLESALASDPVGVQKMLASWSSSFGSLVNRAAAPGGALESRTQSDTEEASQLTARITAMNEVIALHQKNLEAQFTAMEAAVSRNKSQLSWLEAHASSTASSSSSSSSSSIA